ncbi:hypothetical protein ACFQ60_09430 [Streptomyces zhihengii]
MAAGTYLAYSLDRDPREAEVPVLIPRGARSNSVPVTSDEESQVFETSEELTARASWNELAVRRRRPALLTPADLGRRAEIHLSGTATGLTTGDRLLFVFASAAPGPGDPGSDGAAVPGGTASGGTASAGAVTPAGRLPATRPPRAWPSPAARPPATRSPRRHGLRRLGRLRRRGTRRRRVRRREGRPGPAPGQRLLLPVVRLRVDREDEVTAVGLPSSPVAARTRRRTARVDRRGRAVAARRRPGAGAAPPAARQPVRRRLRRPGARTLRADLDAIASPAAFAARLAEPHERLAEAQAAAAHEDAAAWFERLEAVVGELRERAAELEPSRPAPAPAAPAASGHTALGALGAVLPALRAAPPRAPARPGCPPAPAPWSAPSSGRRCSPRSTPLSRRACTRPGGGRRRAVRRCSTRCRRCG